MKFNLSFLKQLGSFGVDDNYYFPGDLRIGVTFSVLCDNHTTLCSVSTLRLRGTLIHTIRQILVALSIIFDQHQRAGLLCVRRLQLRRGGILDDWFDHVNLQPTLFSETVSMVLVRTSRAEYATAFG